MDQDSMEKYDYEQEPRYSEYDMDKVKKKLLKANGIIDTLYESGCLQPDMLDLVRDYFYDDMWKR